MAEKNIQVGDKVEWNYGRGHPQGTAAEINSTSGEKMSLETNKGNTVTRNADEENPAVKIVQSGVAKVVKKMSELQKVAEGEGDDDEGSEEQQATAGKDEPAAGQKRGRDPVKRKGKAPATSPHEEPSKAEDEENTTAQEKAEEPEVKKQKLDSEAETKNTEAVAEVSPDKPPAQSTRSHKSGTTAGRATQGRKASTRSKKGALTAQAKEPAAPSEATGVGESREKPITLEETPVENDPVVIAIPKASGDTEGTNIPVIADMPKAHD